MTALFSETCNRMEQDREWLTSAPHSETTLLFRFFGHLVHRVKELLEYQELLGECLFAVRFQNGGEAEPFIQSQRS